MGEEANENLRAFQIHKILQAPIQTTPLQISTNEKSWNIKKKPALIRSLTPFGA